MWRSQVIMNLAESCRLCEYYHPHGHAKGQGSCNRLDDPSYVYAVRADQIICLYQTSGKKISEEEHKEKLRKARINLKSFESSLENATRIVASWSQWKRDGCGWIGD